MHNLKIYRQRTECIAVLTHYILGSISKFVINSSGTREISEYVHMEKSSKQLFIKVYNSSVFLAETCVLFWGHWYPWFGFLVTSFLGFKARVGSALFVCFMEENVIYIPRDAPLVLHLSTCCLPAVLKYIAKPHSFRNISVIENNRLTIGKQWNHIENFYNPLLTEFAIWCSLSEKIWKHWRQMWHLGLVTAVICLRRTRMEIVSWCGKPFMTCVYFRLGRSFRYPRLITQILQRARNQTT